MEVRQHHINPTFDLQIYPQGDYEDQVLSSHPVGVLLLMRDRLGTLDSHSRAITPTNTVL